MQLVVAERFFPEPVGPEHLAELRRRNAWCRDLHGVRPVRALAAPGQQRYLCLYEAPDAEAVRHYSRAAGTPLERAWPATLVPGSVPADRPLPDDVFVVERLFEAPLSVAALEEKEARLSPVSNPIASGGSRATWRATGGGSSASTMRRTRNPCGRSSGAPACPTSACGAPS